MNRAPLKIRRKRVFIALCVTAVVVLLFFSGRYILFHKIRTALDDRIEVLRKEGIRITFDTLVLDPWSGYMYARGLKVSVGNDSIQPGMTTTTSQLTIEGVELLPFILKKTLIIRSIVLRNPAISYSDKFSLPQKQKSNSTDDDKKLKHLKISVIRLINASAIMKDSLGQDTTAIFSMNLLARHLDIDGDSLAFVKADLLLSGIKLTTPKSFYNFTIQQLHLNLEDKLFTIDSLLVIPKYDRSAFMRKAGEQTSRIEATVPHFSFQELDIRKDNQLHITARKSSVNFNLHVYRDKRYPFLKKTHGEMPMELIQKLPFQFKIDTLQIENSYVKYEEFPEKADSTGYIFFDQINSSLTGIHNKAVKEEDVKMKLTALFMGKGKLSADFTFPSDTTRPYKTTGSLKDFYIPAVNTILEPASKTKIESGTMTNFSFNFIYNKIRSDGKVQLNYKDLKVVSLHKDKNNQKAASAFKSLLINLFVVKRNSDPSVDGDQKTGTILYYRDPRRAIFHYWWKSLFSGLVTAYNLDNIVPDKKDHGRELNKDQKSNKKK